MLRLRSFQLLAAILLPASLSAQSLMMECITAKRQEQRAYPNGLPGYSTTTRAKRLAKVAVDVSIRNLGEESEVSMQVVFFARRAVTNDRVIISQETVPLRFGKGQHYKAEAESPQIEAGELYEYGTSSSRVTDGFTADGWLVQLKSGERILKQVASQSALEEIGRDPKKLKAVKREPKGAASIQGEMQGGVPAAAGPAAKKPPLVANATASPAASPAAAAKVPPAAEATSAPAAWSPAEFDQRVAASRGRAVGKYPELAKAGSPLNQRFVREVARLRAAADPVLKTPDWPERVAESVSGP